MKNASVVKKRIQYGIGDFELIRREEYYYVDKTKIIRDLEFHRYLNRGELWQGTIVRFFYSQKVQEAKEQLRRYEKDERFLWLSRGTQLFRYFLLAYKDRMDILEV